MSQVIWTGEFNDRSNILSFYPQIVQNIAHKIVVLWGPRFFFCQVAKKSTYFVCLSPSSQKLLPVQKWTFENKDWKLATGLGKSASIWKVSGERKVKNVVWKVRSRPLPLIKGPLLSTNDYNHLFLSKLQSFDQNWL